ncbi:hypothetical protein GX51_01957 [Blastomyces parvus]|uniref:Uncharacterized protein n=1 Tax=Blastomyces parvus TaxID=2060905 RepID=A0A2B7XE28_9EURO|nr:hypothetical protein GX51_01957 [Blastomyces parvus]
MNSLKCRRRHFSNTDSEGQDFLLDVMGKMSYLIQFQQQQPSQRKVFIITASSTTIVCNTHWGHKPHHHANPSQARRNKHLAPGSSWN